MLTRLDIYNVRNLEQARLGDLSRTNILYGANGSGKTSVLESIHLLSAARSFRAHTARSVIKHGADKLTVYGEVLRRVDGKQSGRQSGGRSLGIQRGKNGSADIRIAGSVIRSVAELASELPVLVLNSDSFDLLTGSPADRRRFLDWGVFHVEHTFFSVWQRYQRCIRQRNTLLRRGSIVNVELDSWTHELADAGESLTKCRQSYFSQLSVMFSDVIATLLPDSPPVTLQFRRGWGRERALLDVFKDGFSVDREQGFTHSGPQRADIRILVGNVSAADTLSRGQQKLVVSALKLAQGRLFAENSGAEDCVFLLDDLPSELDFQHLRLICDELEKTGAQVFISCIDRADVFDVWMPPGSLSVFHVEHGQITKE
ncbi:MAG: DNA replication/repair protein RecF [Chromatocurvus sp.]